MTLGLGDLANSIFASLGASGLTNPLGLPDANRVALLLVDGMGNDVIENMVRSFQFLLPFKVDKF